MSQLIGLAQVALLKPWGFGVESSGLGCIEGLGNLGFGAFQNSGLQGWCSTVLGFKDPHLVAASAGGFFSDFLALLNDDTCQLRIECGRVGRVSAYWQMSKQIARSMLIGRLGDGLDMVDLRQGHRFFL